jgi:hypothetical protein
MSSGRAGLPGGEWGARGPVGPESQGELDSDEGGFFVGWILGNDRRFLLLLALAENYNLAATDRTAEAQSAQRRLRGNSRQSPAFRFLRAIGGSAGWPLASAAASTSICILEGPSKIRLRFC